MDLNQPAPDFALPDLQGNLHRLSDFRGRIAVVNFWSAECPWAERVDEMLAARLPAWAGRVELLAIAANAVEDDDLLAETARRRGLPLVLRVTPRVLEDYAAQTTPEFFVADADGLLRYCGAYDDVTFRQRTPHRFYLEEAIEALLAGRLPDPPRTPPYGCAILRHLPESC